jgi:hypothetical protein
MVWLLAIQRRQQPFAGGHFCCHLKINSLLWMQSHRDALRLHCILLAV